MRYKQASNIYSAKIKNWSMAHFPQPTRGPINEKMKLCVTTVCGYANICNVALTMKYLRKRLVN